MTEAPAKLLAVVGPTASGKSRMGVEVAQRLIELGAKIEIVSCDSMAVYRGFDITTAKPTEADRGSVPHHLFDVVEPSEDFTVVAYRDLARQIIAEIGARGGSPMLVGGSGLYFRAAVDDLSFAPTDASVRERLWSVDPEELYARLEREDPARAEAIDPRNVRRVVRAVEILELSGRPPSELRGEWERFESIYALEVVGLSWDREALAQRARERIRRQFEAGMVEEVRAAMTGGISRTAMQALGAKEVVDHIEGRISVEEAEAALVRSTKGFVRRQLSWFRADPRVDWLDVSAGWDGCREAIVGRFADAIGLARQGSRG